MFLKKIYKNVVVFVAITFICSGCLSPIKKETQIAEQTPEQTVKNINRDNIKQVEKEKKQDLYQNTSYELPLFSIIEISKLDSKLKKIVDRLLEDSQGFYYLKVIEDGIFIILQHPVSQTNTYSRHDLQFVKISKDGDITYHTAGYSGIDGEIYSTESKVSESWVYDNEQEFLRPIKHTV